MAYSLTSPLLSLFSAELVFGMLYALLVHWISVKHYLRGSTAWSVVVGVAATLLIQLAFVRSCWSPLVTFSCFAFSGLPMVVSYLVRYQTKVEKAKHVRRPWPTAALRARDEAVMDITHMIQEIECAAKANTVTPGFLLQVTNTLHCVKKTLTSV